MHVAKLMSWYLMDKIQDNNVLQWVHTLFDLQ